MGFRDNLRQELNFNGMIVKELAAVSGIKKRALDTYLQSENASMPPADAAVKIARALGVTVEYLITGDDTTLPNDVRLVMRNLLQLDVKDRKIIAILVKALLDRQVIKR